MITSKRNTLLLLAVISLVALYAWLQHKAHVLEYWDYIFFALFIGLHLLMHTGHGHSHNHKKDTEVEENNKNI